MAPVVVLDSGMSGWKALQLTLALSRSGACLRRLLPKGGPPLWFGPHTVLVCGAGTQRWVADRFPHYPQKMMLCGDLADRSVPSLVESIAAKFPDGHGLGENEYSAIMKK